MVYPTLSAIIASSSLAIIRDKDVFFNCFANIKTLSVIFLAFIFIPARAVDRFFAVLSVSAKSFF
jgi:hypothetical protein